MNKLEKIEEIIINLEEFEKLYEEFYEEIYDRIYLRLINCTILKGKEKVEALSITYEFINETLNDKERYKEIIKYMNELKEKINSCKVERWKEYIELKNQLMIFENSFI